MKVKPIPELTKELKARCNSDNQCSNSDRMFRAVISVPKAAVLKEEAKEKRWRKAKKKVLVQIGLSER